MKNKDMRRITLYAKMVFPQIDTRRTKFVLVNTYSVRIPRLMPITKLFDDDPAPHRIEYDDLELSRYSFSQKHNPNGFVIGFAYHQASNTVYHSALVPIRVAA